MKAYVSPTGCSAAAAIVLAGCAGGAPERGPEASRRTTQVFVGNCLTVSGLESAGFDVLASSIISQGFNRIGSTLEASAAEQTWTVTGSTNYESSKATQPKCVQIIQGQFFQDAQPGAGSWVTGTSYAGHVNQFTKRGIHLAARPDFFFEGAFRTSANGAARSIVPLTIGFHKPIGKRPLRRDDGRRIKLKFAFHEAGKAATDSASAVTELDFGMLWPSLGTLRMFDFDCIKPAKSSPAQPSGISGPGTTLPIQLCGAPPDQPGGAPPTQPSLPASDPATPPPGPAGAPGQVVRACATESLWFRTTATDAFSPMSLTATMSQVQDRSDALGFISDVFKSSKTELERITKEELIESEREKARLAALAAQTTLATKYTTAASAALTALDACSTTPTIANRSTARVKQLEANLAASQAGLPAPFAEADMPALVGDEVTAKDTCARAMSKFK
jgi:hypothetical protein